MVVEFKTPVSKFSTKAETGEVSSKEKGLSAELSLPQEIKLAEIFAEIAKN
jgi:hypothetical protein